jgi:hypothetical protein
MVEKLDDKKIDEIREIMMGAGLGEVLLDRMVRGLMTSCDESCFYGCAKCCNQGTANRAVAEAPFRAP